MKNKVLNGIFLLGITVFMACKSGSETSKNEREMVPFEIGRNYFVRNDATYQVGKIETQAEFDQLFAPATTMGEEGKPTPINFSKQFVIAILEPEANMNNAIKLVLLEKSKDMLYVSYQIVAEEKQTFTTVPSLILILDKEYNASVEFIVKT